VRSTASIVAELVDLYFKHGVRVFDFQDDNFFLPNNDKAARRFADFRDGLRRAGVGELAMIVKARPDSITRESIAILAEVGLVRVFLGVENGCDNALRKLNRKNTVDQVVNALRILNDFDLHIAFNLLMFEPHTQLPEILANLRFIERHTDNPFNFCRTEPYPGTALADQLAAEGILLGDYFGYDYRIVDPHAEMFHAIANFAFSERNFSTRGLHYFNMQVDFIFQLLRRFHPQVLTERLRAAVKNFVRQTNLDTYEHLCGIYDFVAGATPGDGAAIKAFARQARTRTDATGARLLAQGQAILARLEEAGRSAELGKRSYRGLDEWHAPELRPAEAGSSALNCFALAPVPYAAFRAQMDHFGAARH
jgi:hypothetical protein